MAKEDTLSFSGRISEVLPGQMYRVLLDNGHTVLAYASGRIKKNKIKILTNDKVDIEVSPYDVTKGRITFRHRG
jgi:translation initiation factor IF-1